MPLAYKEIDAYLLHLTRKRRVSDLYIKNCTGTFERFLMWAKPLRRELTASSIEDFVSEKYSHASSANVNLIRLKGLAEFLDISTAKLTVAKEEHRLTEALDSRELSKLFAPVVDRKLQPTILFLSETGLRVSEFEALDPSNIFDRGSGPMLRVFGKGRKEREVPLSSRAMMAMPYITPMKIDTLQDRMSKAGKAVSLCYGLHPHLLRASFISIALNEKRAEAIKIAVIVGHSSVDTMLKCYYKASAEELHRTVA